MDLQIKWFLCERPRVRVSGSVYGKRSAMWHTTSELNNGIFLVKEQAAYFFYFWFGLFIFLKKDTLNVHHLQFLSCVYVIDIANIYSLFVHIEEVVD
jgi:hypothetical protein